MTTGTNPNRGWREMEGGEKEVYVCSSSDDKMRRMGQKKEE